MTMEPEWKEMSDINDITPKKKWNLPKLSKKTYIIGGISFIILITLLLVVMSAKTQDIVPQVVCEDITPFVTRNDELFNANIALQANFSQSKARIIELDKDRLTCKQELIQAVNNKSLQKCSNQFYVTEIDALQEDLSECLEENNSSNCWNDLQECNEDLDRIKDLLE